LDDDDVSIACTLPTPSRCMQAWTKISTELYPTINY
jgi:hypothetical protein